MDGHCIENIADTSHGGEGIITHNLASHFMGHTATSSTRQGEQV